MEFGVAGVHAEEVAGEERRLVPTGAGADLENGTLLVGGVLGKKQEAHLLGEMLDPVIEGLGFFGREGTHLRIVEEGRQPGAFRLSRA